MARTYGFEILASMTHRGGVESAILFSVIRDFRGERIVCLPFSDYCDPLVDDPKVWQALIRPLQPADVRRLRGACPGLKKLTLPWQGQS